MTARKRTIDGAGGVASANPFAPKHGGDGFGMEDNRVTMAAVSGVWSPAAPPPHGGVTLDRGHTAGDHGNKLLDELLSRKRARRGMTRKMTRMTMAMMMAMTMAAEAGADTAGVGANPTLNTSEPGAVGRAGKAKGLRGSVDDYDDECFGDADGGW